MEITASVSSNAIVHDTHVSTNGQSKSIAIPRRIDAPGSSVNGGELLLLALATCYCNDIYREAAKLGIAVEQVQVEVSGTFAGPGDPASGVTYRARVEANASEAEIAALIAHTDTVAEIQNTLRAAIPIELASYEAVSLNER